LCCRFILLSVSCQQNSFKSNFNSAVSIFFATKPDFYVTLIIALICCWCFLTSSSELYLSLLLLWFLLLFLDAAVVDKLISMQTFFVGFAALFIVVDFHSEFMLSFDKILVQI